MRPLEQPEIDLIAAALDEEPTFREEFLQNARYYAAQSLDDFGSLEISGGPVEPLQPDLNGKLGFLMASDPDAQSSMTKIEVVIFFRGGLLKAVDIYSQDGSSPLRPYSPVELLSHREKWPPSN